MGFEALTGGIGDHFFFGHQPRNFFEDLEDMLLKRSFVSFSPDVTIHMNTLQTSICIYLHTEYIKRLLKGHLSIHRKKNSRGDLSV